MCVSINVSNQMIPACYTVAPPQLSLGGADTRTRARALTFDKKNRIPLKLSLWMCAQADRVGKQNRKNPYRPDYIACIHRDLAAY